MSRRLPWATYRLQFNRGFTFRDAGGGRAYLADLGVSDLYASPILKARPGSNHGYDVIDHGELNPELGGEAGVRRRSSTRCAARAWGCCWTSCPTTWASRRPATPGGWTCWRTAPARPTPGFFDIDWRPLKPELEGQGAAAGAGRPVRRGAGEGSSSLVYEDGRFFVRYYEPACRSTPRDLPTSPGADALPALDRATRRRAATTCWSCRASCARSPPARPHATPTRPGAERSAREGGHQAPARRA